MFVPVVVVVVAQLVVQLVLLESAQVPCVANRTKHHSSSFDGTVVVPWLDWQLPSWPSTVVNSPVLIYDDYGGDDVEKSCCCYYGGDDDPHTDNHYYYYY